MTLASVSQAVKKDNHPRALSAKVELRRRACEFVGTPRVFDAFAGSGQMHAAVWRDAGSYVGCDRKAVAALARIMQSSIGLRLEAKGKTQASVRYILLGLVGRVGAAPAAE